ncbi:hypothetical protein FHT86_001060 [Rhizobium sp. BK313]|uniref:hypothetical protein n=1 Tax=Rhizobium sp. BK313 TaxID=2587081 RepID=UPI00105BDEFB|nr:hypothetical protein [Rhizobium sp. BK313]MBB3452804.1 hypothetical protein [Rhizobium sp. BK313]
MWVDLDEDDIAKIVQAVGPGLYDKLIHKSDPDAEKFRDAANEDDYTHVAIDAPVDRTRNGAYVLCWRWVYNETVGYLSLSDFDEYDIADSTREKIEALREFQLDDFDIEDECGCLSDGAIDKARWELSLKDGVLKFAILEDDSNHAELWSYSSDWTVTELNVDVAFDFISKAVNRYRASTPNGEFEPVK